MTYMVELVALRPLYGDYGFPPAPRSVDEGQRFKCPDHRATELQAKGLAKLYRPPAPPVQAEATAVSAIPPGPSVDAILAKIRENQKMQAVPENKMLKVEENKAETPPKRKRGRPRKK